MVDRPRIWPLGWLLALGVLACAAPQAQPPPTSVSPTAWFTPNPNEPWKLTATAEVLDGHLRAAAAQAAAESEAAQAAEIAVHVDAAKAYERAGDYGLALEELRQTAGLVPESRSLSRSLATMQRVATQAAPTQWASATRAASTLVAEERAARTSATAEAIRGAQAATRAAYERVCRLPDGRRVYDTLREYTQDWLDDIEVARSTARIALSTPISRLQALRRDLQRERWPACAGQAPAYFERSMQAFIDGMLQFQRGTSAATVSRTHFTQGYNDARAGLQQLERIAR
jgi:hypothetical protein